MTNQLLVADFIAHEDSGERGYGPVQQLTILAIHDGRENLKQIRSLLTSEVDLAQRTRRDVGVDE